METLLQSLAQQAGPALAIAFATLAALGGWLAKESSVNRKVRRRWRELLQTEGGASLEETLETHLEERRKLHSELRALQERVRVLEDKMRVDKRHLGIVRYDAFDDVGGEQSFAMALYDDEGDGIVLTSLVGRTDCRVYAKALRKGRSDRTLSQEEQRAIREAEATYVAKAGVDVA